MSALIKKIICLCLILFFVFPMVFITEKYTVRAVDWQYDMALPGNNHTLSDFPASYYYNDGVREGTLYRDDSSLRTEVREYHTLSYERNTEPRRYDPDYTDIASLFPVSLGTTFTDPDTGIGTYYRVYPTNMWWGELVNANYIAYHHGEDFRGDHDNLGWMYSNPSYYRPYRPIGNLTAWYFSRTPAQPLSYYPPNDGSPVTYNWAQLSIGWDGGMQDAQSVPWFWDLVDLYGYMNPQRFISETGVKNRYRKPVRITYFANGIGMAYAYAYYSLDVPLYNTVVTYKGDVSGGAGPWIDVDHEGSVIIGQDLTITIDTGDPDSPSLETYVTYHSTRDPMEYVLYDSTHTTGVRQYGTIPDILPETTYTVTGITEDESGNTATDIHIISVGELDWLVDIDHTEQWKENMQAWDEWNERLSLTDNRYEDLFFRGEAFVAIVQTTAPIDFDSIECELQIYNNSVQLTTTDNMTWTGEIWEQDSILWEEQQATFVFTIQIGTYTDTKTIIVDVDEDFYFLYHEID